MTRNTFFSTLLIILISPILALAQPTSPACLTYSRIANLSTIASNSTYRSAFLQAAPDGTLQTGNMLNAAMAQLPTLTNNAALNQQCGNLTTVALTEAEKNFTEGIVAQFSGIEDPQQIFAGIALIPMFGVLGIIFYGVWSHM